MKDDRPISFFAPAAAHSERNRGCTRTPNRYDSHLNRDHPIVETIGRQPQRAPDGAPVHYERHRPEQTTLYRLVQHYAANIIAHTEARIGAELFRFQHCPNCRGAGAVTAMAVRFTKGK